MKMEIDAHGEAGSTAGQVTFGVVKSISGDTRRKRLGGPFSLPRGMEKLYRRARERMKHALLS